MAAASGGAEVRRLLFVGGPLHGQVHPVSDDMTFDAPDEDETVYGRVTFGGTHMMVSDPRWDELLVRDAMFAFFAEQSKRVVEGDA